MTGRVGTAAMALRIGLGVARAGSGAPYRWALIVASFVGVLVAWGFVAAQAVADRHDQRLLDRGPAFTTDDSTTVAYWYDRIDYLNDRQFLVVYVAPVDVNAKPPPGLPRWPRPGEAFVSEALLAADSGARDRYGQLAGTIGNDGLLDSTEWLVYTSPLDLAAFARVDRNTRVSGFGRAGGDRPVGNANIATTIGSAEITWLFVVVVAFPALILVVTAVRTGAERRDRRLALLDSLGAPGTARAWSLVGEAVRPIAIGSAFGAAASAITTWIDTPIPGTGFTVWASDLDGSRWWIPAVGSGVGAGLLALVVLVQLRPRSAGQTRPQSLSPQLRYWPQVVFPLALATTFSHRLSAGGRTPG